MGAARNTSLRYPGGWRALWGALAYVAGFALFVPVSATHLRELLSGATITIGASEFDVADVAPPEAISDATGAAILYANAQFVPLSLPLTTRSGTVAGTANLLLQAGGWYLLLFLVPPVLLAVSGAMATRDLYASNPTRRAKAATLQFTGTLPLGIGTVLGFTISAPGGSGGPDILWGIVVLGWLYPTVFGALGGYLAGRLFGSGSLPSTLKRTNEESTAD